MKPPRGLPDIDGSWELLSLDIDAGAPVRVWAPRDPERLLDDEAVIERNDFNDSMPYWAWLWDSAPTMARLLRRDPPKPGSRVLELGAGLGFNGIAAAIIASDPIELVLSDHDPLSLAALAANLELNGLDKARVWNLDWRQLTGAPDGRFDLILACDVAYEAKLQEPLLDVVDRYLAPQGRALFADPGRTRLPGLVRRARARGFRVDLADADGIAAVPEAGAFRLATLSRDQASVSDAS